MQVIRVEGLQEVERDLVGNGGNGVEVGGAGDAAGNDIGEERLVELDDDLPVETARDIRGVGVDTMKQRLGQLVEGAAVGEDAVAVGKLNARRERPGAKCLHLNLGNSLTPDLLDLVEVALQAVPRAAREKLRARRHAPRTRAAVNGNSLQHAGRAAHRIRAQPTLGQLRDGGQLRLPHDDIRGLREGGTGHRPKSKPSHLISSYVSPIIPPSGRQSSHRKDFSCLWNNLLDGPFTPRARYLKIYQLF